MMIKHIYTEWDDLLSTKYKMSDIMIVVTISGRGSIQVFYPLFSEKIPSSNVTLQRFMLNGS